MSTPEKDLVLANGGTRRVIIGPGPRSKGGGGKLVRFDTAADAKIPEGKRLGQTHKLTGADAERVRTSKVVEALKDRLELKAG